MASGVAARADDSASNPAIARRINKHTSVGAHREGNGGLELFFASAKFTFVFGRGKFHSYLSIGHTVNWVCYGEGPVWVRGGPGPTRGLMTTR